MKILSLILLFLVVHNGVKSQENENNFKLKVTFEERKGRHDTLLNLLSTRYDSCFFILDADNLIRNDSIERLIYQENKRYVDLNREYGSGLNFIRFKQFNGELLIDFYGYSEKMGLAIFLRTYKIKDGLINSINISPMFGDEFIDYEEYYNTNLNDKNNDDDLITINIDAPKYEKNIFRFISKNIIYPETALNDSLEGSVYVDVWIDRDGTTKDHKVLKEGVRDDLNAEAIRVAKLIKYDYPAMQMGKPIVVRYTIPIKFSLFEYHVNKNIHTYPEFNYYGLNGRIVGRVDYKDFDFKFLEKERVQPLLGIIDKKTKEGYFVFVERIQEKVFKKLNGDTLVKRKFRTLDPEKNKYKVYRTRDAKHTKIKAVYYFLEE